MPRKRTIPDDDLLDAALDLVRASGPDSLTFAALAAQTGLAASTLVQRFGAKPALLHAALSLAWDQLDAQTAAALDAAPSGATGVVDLLVRLTGGYDAARPGPGDEGERFADQLLLLREDLRDPLLRARGEAWLGVLSRAVDKRLAASLPHTRGVGRLVVTYWQGSLTVWSFTRERPLVDAVRTGLRQLLNRLGAR